MKKLVYVLFLLGFATFMNAQLGGNGHQNPAELNEINVTGTAIVLETNMNSAYFFDEDGDGNADYHLNFGPIWYSPDSSLAARPVNGDVITIIGGVHDSFNMTEQTIIVYEINGEFWRDPYFAEWNNMGNHNHQMGNHHGGGMFGYGFGWEHDSIVSGEFSGTALVDTTFYMNKYYLDVDNDSIPDFYLNFGPVWFEAESGALRPISGDNITIKGGQISTSMEFPMVIVYEINGLTWRDSSTIGNHFGGGWFHSGITDSQQFHSPFDSMDQMMLRSGWNSGGGHHGGGMYTFDSLFCQILEVYPENVPNTENMDVFAGYEIQMFDPAGNSMMRNGGMMGGHMEMGSKVGYQLHYTDKQMQHYGANENSMDVKYWDNLSNSWMTVSASINTETNTVRFENSVVSNYVVLSFDKTTAVGDVSSVTPNDFSLEQNYPNPFNPTSTIKYQLPNAGFVTLKVYDVLGKEVAALVNQEQTAGSHQVNFDGSNLASGIYFYELKNGNYLQIKKMMILK